MQNLKPKTQYHFSKEDLEFIIELVKVGYVHMLSSQVTLHSRKCIQFKEFSGDNDGCDGLKLPENWIVEGIYGEPIGQYDADVKITFGIKKMK